MNKIQRKRFEKLMNHLASGKLGLDKFDYGTWYAKRDCGTCGCALGECTVVFPKQWKARALSVTLSDEYIVTGPSDRGDPSEDAAEFFGISHEDAECIFCGEPLITGDWETAHVWIPELSMTDSTTAAQVAARMKKYLKLYDSIEFWQARANYEVGQP